MQGCSCKINWLVEKRTRKEHEKIIFECFDDRHALLVYSLIVESGLGFSIAMFG